MCFNRQRFWNVSAQDYNLTWTRRFPIGVSQNATSPANFSRKGVILELLTLLKSWWISPCPRVVVNQPGTSVRLKKLLLPSFNKNMPSQTDPFQWVQEASPTTTGQTDPHSDIEVDTVVVLPYNCILFEDFVNLNSI